MPEKTSPSGKRAGCLGSAYHSCASCCTTTLRSIKGACCPSYKLYEDDEGAVTPVRAEAPVLQPVPYHTTTTSLQPQVSQWKPTVLGPPSKVIGKTSDPDEKRERAAAAAEQREEQHRTRGLGSSARGSSLEDAGRKDELIGRIVEVYTANREDPPLGLRLMSVKQLREHYQTLKQRFDTKH
ncbi:hypothetical protein Pmar_PMAR015322 [Perkinsus marinus ATCC 50983]|uniref:Uncharacterized protein n=1 Tax=Perkinsus marinus (strain ATCC 50983 / TXsc) TaxID=423536 RepID=C5KLA4_PERM5|nr:hypothetical protein Pmar_PMAR015322 [Perkinsus marinus ATCC 50983]EER14777.1 hypothetical protein Pmar_PMAR015322 [Perkinsus marinus ATCC 50983]|eukprot:XP_002782981.1 hypothetical protein Pmar_PMAR015322 [Perkinsus marinus ATCC 50983]